MAKISKQATADGRMVDDYDPDHPTMQQREAVLLDGFTARGWKIENMSSDEPKRRTVMQVSRGDRSYKLNVFVFPNLAYASRHAEEKRIQLSRDYAEHKREFELPNDGPERCLLLGMYIRDGKTVVSAWDAAAYRNHAQPSSCYVRVPALADAMRNGFGQSIDGKNRLVCCFQPDLLAYYVENMHDLHEKVIVDQNLIKTSLDGEPDEAAGDESTDEINVPPNAVPADLPRNRILYGAPGTGKSHRLDSEVSAYFGDETLHERVTFHPDYTYGQLVGAYRPVPLYREGSGSLLAADKVTDAGKHEPLIDYAFVPGPFLRLLVRALKNPGHKFVLVIEELNRANAPAVFGEVFQLLDRDNQGVGKFPVMMPTEARDYLRSHGLPASVRLPANLYLWATMNSADQGVMPLDAAFKRRWTFEYVPLNASEDVTAEWMIHLNFLGGSVPWNTFRAAINDHLRKREVPEDRLLGPFFMRQEELENGQAFRNKLLLYLRDDVVRHNPEALFRGASLSYGALADSYEKGDPVFAEGIDFGAADQGS
ncbi:AAA domain-containing protein [Sphingobium sp. TB-6]|uniref:AAA family ATPase n=1 Tax=Sphingobium sp. TB-6 TaxID=2728850 RepID=UPI00146A98C5|nr:AAA family ATPase [Sphingobium sp. TB-6]NML92003.1 AAA domain-containing protein [Sphingobium sp. TB-6]